ncbi:MAG: hypothetical protein IM486_05080 [Microcystis sp. M114S2]|jgi:hypothetical protein|uniref:hypothetical protein n=1 Tax=Microcystis TaxID=1125 RepID=UPI001561E3FE|nr:MULTISPECIES: hypothetical protein [Microcystis]MDJ0559561.1 hypothetical protein [Microcystis sp. M53599_WE4]MCA2667866.1 hypothetical protein [Microcystis sp. M045S2]MCA2714459.1 hypothetical protein [Microcystis sp. M172S2]MCA2803476.1 hypothetical protein [Microcystis sp. M114S2]MCA2811801.1 hypothetical protein [Microcystis sp. M090S1]
MPDFRFLVTSSALSYQFLIYCKSLLPLCLKALLAQDVIPSNLDRQEIRFWLRLNLEMSGITA